MVARTIEFAAAAMGGRRFAGTGDAPWAGAALDSRRVTGGELFFALRGAQADGHDFAAAAARAGAAGIVVERELSPPDDAAAAWLRVDDSYAALHALTLAVRAEVPRRLVSITGSAGKTTTKELLAAMLARRFRVARSPGNLNNLFGFPLALLAIDDDTEWMVAEMGMSTPRELAGVARLGRPDVAVYTNVRAVHLENFDSVRGIAEAKAEMLEGLAEDGTIIANADDPEVLRIASRHVAAHPGVRLVTYGLEAADADVRGRDLQALAELGIDRPGTRFVLRSSLGGQAREIGSGAIGSGAIGSGEIGSGEIAVELGVHGLYNVENALAAAAASLAVGVSLDDVAAACAAFRPAQMRGEVHRLASGVLLIDDSYNSNPAAAERALESAHRLPARRRLAVLGDMLELGPTAAELHEQVGRRAAELGFEVLAVGPLARDLAAGARAAGGVAESVDEAAAAAEWLRAEARSGALAEGDLVLIKGSRGVGLEVAVEALRADWLAATNDGEER
ncbi:MAG: Mur ligase family protein [Acidobacteriota bacterium]